MNAFKLFNRRCRIIQSIWFRRQLKSRRTETLKPNWIDQTRIKLMNWLFYLTFYQKCHNKIPYHLYQFACHFKFDRNAKVIGAFLSKLFFFIISLKVHLERYPFNFYLFNVDFDPGHLKWRLLLKFKFFFSISISKISRTRTWTFFFNSKEKKRSVSKTFILQIDLDFNWFRKVQCSIKLAYFSSIEKKINRRHVSTGLNFIQSGQATRGHSSKFKHHNFDHLDLSFGLEGKQII